MSLTELNIVNDWGPGSLKWGISTRASLVLSWQRTHLQCGRPGSIPGWARSPEKGMVTHSSILAWRIPWLYSIWDCNESDTTEKLSLHLGFPCESVGKESACNVGDLGSIPGLGRPPGEGNGCPLQCYGLENSMDSIDIHLYTLYRYPPRI